MGRKGVSKRKPSQKIGKQLSNGNANNNIFPVGRATVSQLVKSTDTDKAIISATQGKIQPSSVPKKKP